MTKSVNVHAYRIHTLNRSRSLEAVLEQVSGDAISKRNRFLAGVDLRVEDIRKTDSGDLWLMDFVLMRYEGPAKVAHQRPASDWDLEEDDRFGEETAALFDPSAQSLYVQFNHRGVRAARMVDYFSKYSPSHNDAFDPHVEYEDGLDARLERLSSIRKLNVGVATDAISDANKDNDLALSHAAAIHRELGGNFVEITVQARYVRHGGLSNKARELLKRLKGHVDKGDDQVKRLKVKGFDDEREVSDELDLISERKSSTFEASAGDGRRLTRDQRYRGLQRARSEIIGNG